MSLVNQFAELQVESQKPATKSKRASPLSGEARSSWFPDVVMCVMLSECNVLAELHVERAVEVAVLYRRTPTSSMAAYTTPLTSNMESAAPPFPVAALEIVDHAAPSHITMPEAPEATTSPEAVMMNRSTSASARGSGMRCRSGRPLGRSHRPTRGEGGHRWCPSPCRPRRLLR